ncbi:MAG TPA: UDP-N-acetylmuramoyl-L-alanine--D-glutamate ligase [Phycisphaerae bacterium]|nr:UDP-N-acetylmuramoyl-L-alanine--D-glutamate ligase [Phycisphaerae bacterium]
MNVIPNYVSDEQLAGARVVVMGLGRFGGGVGVTRFLVGRGANVLVTDMADAATLQTPLNALSDLKIEYRLGSHDVADLDGADLLVVSPAVDRTKSAFVQAALNRGIAWTTEMGMFIERCPGRMIGVTGSIGKSTTCAMLHCILESERAKASANHRRTFLGGNIGRSLLGDLTEMTADDLIVLELSSFQLEALPNLTGDWPVVGITNIAPHHLDRHGGYEPYIDAKLNLIRGMSLGASAVVGRVDDSVRKGIEALVRYHKGHTIKADILSEHFDLQVPGPHNQMNAQFAALIARQLGVELDASRAALKDFGGLAHRIQYADSVDGVRYYNDSKSTSVEAIDTALRSFAEPVVLLCGGKDTGSELERIKNCTWQSVRAVVSFGDAAKRLADMIGTLEENKRPKIVQSEQTIDAAIAKARTIAQSGDVVLLSPGCPSYDAFSNYEERGDAFIAAVKSLR